LSRSPSAVRKGSLSLSVDGIVMGRSGDDPPLHRLDARKILHLH
jgi:hypothetical protein